MMTLKEFKADLERETCEPGEKLSRAAAKALYSQYREHEAEAVAGGRDEVVTEDLNDHAYRYDAHDPNFDLDTHDLDSTGHVLMTSPELAELEIEFFSRYDDARERFAGTGDDFCDYDEPTEEEIADAKAFQLEIDSTVGAFSYWTPAMSRNIWELRRTWIPVAENDVPF